MKIRLNDNFGRIKESYLFSDIAKKANAYQAANPGKKIIRLGIGDVTLPLTPCVTRAMQKAVAEQSEKQSFRGYAPEYGYDFIRAAVSDYYSRRGVSISADEIYVGDGAKSDLGNITDILGDNKILIPSPVYPVYVDSNLMCGREITLINADAENNFLPAPPEGDTTYVIYLCSPNNPTGAVYTREGLAEWINYALRSGSLIIFDSAYESYIDGDYPRSVYEIPGARECAIEINSLSKRAGFTGTRCGWTIVPEELESGGVKLGKLWARRQATKFNGVPYVVQRGAEASLSPEGEAECRELIGYYKKNAQIIASALELRGVWFTGGKNSPYIWMKCPGGMGSWEFFDYLLNRIQVVGTPGEGFGAAGEGYFRLTAFGDRSNTEEAAERLKTLL
ncbi:MAG TPA: LL-diaminopimelate aminotransferase [Clostridiales bacterium]|nr:LL-diaminopimelate aminotransferase [Clostridiales bacterium]